MKARLFVVVALLLAFTAVVSAQDKVQANPSEKPDSRLDQKVTYQAKEQFLYKVLDELTEKTGVAMDCGKNKKDWQVRETKVNIFIKDMPLKDLQQNLASLLHYTWARSTSKDGVVSYRLYQTLKLKKEEEKLQADAKEAKAKKRMEMRKKALDELERVVALSSDEIDKLQETAPLQYVFAKDPIGKAMVDMLKAVPEAKAALLEGREVSIPISGLSPNAKAAVTAYRQAYQNFTHQFESSGTSESDSAELDKDSQLTISQQDDSLHSYESFSDTMLGSVDLEGDGMPLFNFDSPAAKVMGKMVAAMYDKGTELSQYEEEQMGNEMMQLAAKSLELPDALKSDPDDPDLAKAAKLDLSKCKKTSDLFEDIAAKTGLQIISDCFDEGSLRSSMMRSAFAKPGDTVGSVLKYAALICSKRAVKTGKVVTFEDREWFDKRTWAVPDEWMERWRQLVKDKNLSLDDLADMVCFTDDQLKYTICEDDSLRQYSWTIENNTDILRLYTVLSNSQKKAILTEEGLDPASLNDKQWAFYANLALKSKVSLYDGRGAMVPMFLLLNADEKNKSYEFDLFTKKQNAENEEFQSPVKTWGIYLNEPDLDEESIDEITDENNQTVSPVPPEAPAGQPNAPQQ